MNVNRGRHLGGGNGARYLRIHVIRGIGWISKGEAKVLVDDEDGREKVRLAKAG